MDSDEPKAGKSSPEGAGELTHLSPEGQVWMVDVGRKPVTARRAVASAVVAMSPDTARRIADRDVPKGDVLAAARLAGIMAAKKTSELLPLCHPLALTRVAVQLDVDADRGKVHIKTATEAHDRTGVEMEALTAASVAALTVYDMVKSVDRSMTIEQVMLLEKSGGRSGHYRRLPDEPDEPG
ncbi:MAG: cyclic pyranopterin monophosphate synthase MoaC [Deltaproteobacteria bacterium]|jgi:cyclic pyranopterin phosphate synthase|nr:cyclic pyranopterin monophosphate synthase MoaC [Deltaproteobacteria bacterium]MBW2532137.1 cyclic pyranopterin monophosphate synthase MoaC [Deltaproteobacteria bacterium]